MCKGEWCPIKDSCYRHACKADKYSQSYFVDSPFDGEKCEFYRAYETKNVWHNRCNKRWAVCGE